MTGTEPNEAAHRKLRISMAAGALYDLVFAVLILAAPGWGAWFLDLPLPTDQIYLRFIGIFLLALALFYMLPVVQPGQYLGNVVVAVVARACGAAFLLCATVLFGAAGAFAMLGLGDLAFAVLHAWLLRRAEGGGLLRHYFG